MLMSSPLSRATAGDSSPGMRSQAAVFGGAFVMALAHPTGSLFARLRGLAGIWLLMTTGHVFGTIISQGEKMRRGRRMPASPGQRCFCRCVRLAGLPSRLSAVWRLPPRRIRRKPFRRWRCWPYAGCVSRLGCSPHSFSCCGRQPRRVRSRPSHSHSLWVAAVAGCSGPTHAWPKS